jgi:hypothetical protein
MRLSGLRIWEKGGRSKESEFFTPVGFHTPRADRNSVFSRTHTYREENEEAEGMVEQPTNEEEIKDLSQEAEKSAVWTDEEFEAFIEKELKKEPLRKEYPGIFEKAPNIISSWRQRYEGNSPLWKRLFHKGKVLKEFIDAAPFIDAIQRLVINTELRNGEKFRIIDLACGRGYLSMFLSELLPSEKVERCILVDKQWPMHNAPPKPHHINWGHIYGSFKDSSIPFNYYESWPVTLNTSKINLKNAKEVSNMEERLFQNYQGPIILVAVHLCGTLSIKAVELFNRNPETKFFCLKPCCLPTMVHAKRNEIFELGGHSFPAKEVCMAGKWKKGEWHGPPRTTTKQYFERWVQHLFLGIDGAEAKKIKKTIMVQRFGGYQNEFLLAERLPETSSVWDALLHR